MVASPNLESRLSAGATFAAAPASWFYLASLAELDRGPRKVELPDGETFVGFREEGGRPVVLTGRCSHMGADLSRGCIKNGEIACPLHGWVYNSLGQCSHIPSSGNIPAFARQQRYPVEVRAGHVFFFNRSEARFPMPFFEGIDPDSLTAAAPFDLWDDVPWYLVGGNGFDRQHFENTHDRRLIADPVMDAPHPYARRSQLELAVEGHSYLDWLTRGVAGNRSRMTVTSWCGSLVFATATFRRVQTYGLVAVRPLANWSTHARVIVWVRKSGNPLSRLLLDPINALLRRHFIKAFFQSDLGRLSGTRYHPGRMIPSDQHLVDYLTWLQQIHR
jgi:phenylpropionate dioxygenase-like ring-hydroxylating dioxygenase large terminal subunit